MSFSLPPDLRTLLSGVHRGRLTADAVLLSYVAADYFRILRFPTHPDRASDGRQPEFCEVRKRFGQIKQAELVSLRNGLAQLYCYTQKRLKSEFPGKSSVPLYRSVGKGGGDKIGVDDPELYPLLVAAATQERKTTFESEVDVVSGWSQVAQPMYGCLILKRNWPLEDILLVSDHLDQPESLGPMETDEWLCINRCRDGLLTFCTNECKLNWVPDSVPPHETQLKKIKDSLADRSRHYRPSNLGIRARRANWIHRLLSWVAHKWG